MSYIRTISISTVLIIQTTNSFAATIDDDFKHCASKALQSRGQSTAAITVDTGGLREQDFDHNISNRVSRYRLQVTSKASGKDLGIVSCTFDRAGELVTAAFDR
jgi:hypothetical protein